MKRYKLISKVSLVLLMAVSLNLAMVPSIGAARLTSAKDTMTRTQASGTGAATAGYTQSTASVTDGFNIVSTSNNIICLDTDGTLGITTLCLDTGQIKVNLITNGGLISGVVYTGDQIAAAIKTAIEAADTDADDTYTVTYGESTDKFTIRGDGGNTFNPAIGWALYAGADNAAATLGYTIDDTNLRGADAVSDGTVAFNVVTGSNNTFNVRVDAEGPNAVTITAGPYTAATLVTEIDTRIDAASTSNVTVSYASSKFKITSDATGAGSSIVVTVGANDFLKTVKLVNDVPVNGKQASGLVVANHTIQFVTPTGVNSTLDTIVITFPAEFTLPAALNFEDMDLAVDNDGACDGAWTDKTLAAAAAAGVWGAGVAGQVITFTAPTNAGAGEITAGFCVQIEIGRNATAGVAGVEQITNPTTVGLYQITLQVTDGGVLADDTYVGVYIIPDDSVLVTATVDPILAMSLYGGTYIDFGTLEPNAYHKLGGAKNAYGYISLTGVTVDGSLEGEYVTVRGIRYEFSDDGVIVAASNAKVDIVDNANNYLTTSQVAANLYRVINNYDGDLVRANVNPVTTDKVYVMATQPGIAANAWAITENSHDPNLTVSGATFAGGLDGYNQKGNLVTYGAGNGVGNGATGTNIVISTNAVGGYVLTIRNTDTNGPNDNFDGLTNGIVEITQWAGSSGYGILASSQSARYGDGTSTIIEALYRGDGAGDVPYRMRIESDTLASYAGTTAGDNIAIEYNIRIRPEQAAGLYTDTVTYILTSTF